MGLVPDEFKHLVRSMLVIEPNVRPDALQITKVTSQSLALPVSKSVTSLSTLILFYNLHHGGFHHY